MTQKNTKPLITHTPNSFDSAKFHLMDWYLSNARDLPWRKTRNPYHIWLSEIILQQTRVEQGRPYYERFVKHFPSVKALAKASPDQVFKMWEGLGYYRRAQNMLRTAQIIVSKHNGRFPSNYDDLLSLPGIGPYTAAAIASIAFDRPVAVLDGNVARVLARFFGYTKPINAGSGPRDLQALAQTFLNYHQPGTHNQALMELGALVCTPRNPNCHICPLKTQCYAFAQKHTSKIPVKKPARPIKPRRMDFLLSIYQGRLSIEKRTQNDIWHNLYQFPLREELPKAKHHAAQQLKKEFGLNQLPVFVAQTTHLLTHRKLFIRFWITNEFLARYKYVPWNQLSSISFPIVLRRFLAGLKNSHNFDFNS